MYLFLLCFGILAIGLGGNIALCLFWEDNSLSLLRHGFLTLFVITSCFGIIFLLSLLIGSSSRISVKADIQSYKALQITLNDARKNHRTYELATIQQKVIKANEDIAVDKFYAKNNWTNWFFPKAILKIKFIK